jgi:hypothetical protein
LTPLFRETSFEVAVKGGTPDISQDSFAFDLRRDSVAGLFETAGESVALFGSELDSDIENMAPPSIYDENVTVSESFNPRRDSVAAFFGTSNQFGGKDRRDSVAAFFTASPSPNIAHKGPSVSSEKSPLQQRLRMINSYALAVTPTTDIGKAVSVLERPSDIALPVEEGGDESEMELIDDSDEGMSHPESL